MQWNLKKEPITLIRAILPKISHAAAIDLLVM